MHGGVELRQEPVEPRRHRPPRAGVGDVLLRRVAADPDAAIRVRSLDRLRQILTDMRGTFDVIVVDTPPVLAVSDPLIIAAHVDGMIVVAKSGKTRIESLRKAAETLQRGAIRIVGVVINQQNGKVDGGYYANDYHAVAERPIRPFKRNKPAEPKPEALAPAD